MSSISALTWRTHPCAGAAAHGAAAGHRPRDPHAAGVRLPQRRQVQLHEQGGDLSELQGLVRGWPQRSKAWVLCGTNLHSMFMKPHVSGARIDPALREPDS